MINDLVLETNDSLPLRDLVFITIRQAILRGDLEPGEKLMEVALANQLGVSRTPVREAMRKLELEGLLVMQPGKSAQVASITEKDMKDVLELRCSLDAFSVKLAMERMKSDVIFKLKQANKEFEKAVESKEVLRIVEADVKYHDIIYNATENNRLVQMISNLREQMYRYRLEYIKDTSNHQMLIKEHDEIIRLMASGDVVAAQKMMMQHIQNQEQYIYKIAKH